MTDLVKRLRDPREHRNVVHLNLEAADEIEKLRDALDNIIQMHDGNPSLVMADIPPLAYARHIMVQMRKEARTALKEVK